MSIVEATARIADPVIWRKIDEHADKHTNTGASARVARLNSLATADKYIAAHKAALESAGYRIVPVEATGEREAREKAEAALRGIAKIVGGDGAYVNWQSPRNIRMSREIIAEMIGQVMLDAAPKETP